jgi:hypothetical protein
MNIDSLTGKLRTRADRILRDRLHKAFYALREEFTDGSTKPIIVQGGYVPGQVNTANTFCVDAHAALLALEDLSFNMQRDKAQAKEIDDFMQQVEILSKSIEEIQNNL